MPASTRSTADVQTPNRRTAPRSKVCKTPANKLGGSTPTSTGKHGKYLQTVNPFPEGFDPAIWIPNGWKTLFVDCSTKEEFRAILKEFLMLAFWRVRHYEMPVIENMLQFLQPRRQGVINAIDEVATFESMMKELQSLIIFAHEVCARIWLETPTGAEFQANMQRLRSQKRKIPIVQFEKIEGVLQLTNTELMSLWSPIVSAAKLDYWDERNGHAGRAFYNYMRNSSYDLIGYCIGFLQGENKAELDISYRARQWALNEVSSQKGLTYWPERDRPLPSTYPGWMALPQHFESPEENADFKGLMARFNFHLDRNIPEDIMKPDLCGNEKSGGEIAEVSHVRRVDEGGPSGERSSMTIEGDESGFEYCMSGVGVSVGGQQGGVSTGKEISEGEVNKEKSIPMSADGGEVGEEGGGADAMTREGSNVDGEAEELEMLSTRCGSTEGNMEGIEFLGQKYKGKERCGEVLRGEMGLNNDYISDSDDMYSAPQEVHPQKLFVVKREPGDDNNDEVKGADCDETDDTSSDDSDEETRIVRRYGGLPGVYSTSIRMDVASMTQLEENQVGHSEKFGKDAMKSTTAFLQWVHMREIMLHEDRKTSRRYRSMGILGRAAYVLAELQALNKIYKDVVVEMVNRQKKNVELMKQIEEFRLLTIENDRLYEEALAKTRQSSRGVSVARSAEQKPSGSELLDSVLAGSEKRTKKRKQPETPESLIFGLMSEKMAKKLRNNSFLGM